MPNRNFRENRPFDRFRPMCKLFQLDREERVGKNAGRERLVFGLSANCRRIASQRQVDRRVMSAPMRPS